MSYDAKVFNVMVASPGDVLAERAVFREVIHEWNAINSEVRKVVLMPVGWETHSSPEMGAGPQEIINQQVLHRCDLLVGIFWTRAGTPTTEFASGTVEEIERHIAAGRLAMLYFSSTPAAMDDVDLEQYQSLKEFKSTCRDRGLYESYDSLTEFRNKFSRQLQQKLNAHEMFKLAQTDNSDRVFVPEIALPVAPSLTIEARVLLKEVSQDAHGRLSYIRYLGGSDLQSNGKNFFENSERREIARWEGALQQLQEQGLIVERGHKGEFFEITAKGYEVADKIDL
ncbi:DUF4062 domain-containing protein [Pseudomonas fluorescens]|uniref:DUF4062 domain-containing protein n=1 Tax=Pseudomonas fluorescens TaxID=294 RepID=UPI001903633B|nr:DUF4062 domain-containing protein [Pseudomonas fluorescens]MBD8091703.1 DUF4062 domain-containing protein [Pseudomonas fluorescens]MBD8716174.1 DUF4062 domain-containing protein [Pseudomonas fluorescens]